MAKKKTSAELAKEQSEIAKVEGMLGDAFGSLGGLEQTTQEENKEEIVEDSSEEVEAIAEVEEEEPSDDNVEENQDLEEEEITLPSGPPSGPPTGPPSGPPSGPPMSPPVETSEEVASPPSSPPSGPPSKPPTGPPSGPPSSPPSGPPSGPPSKPPSGPPSKSPSGPPSESPSEPPNEPSAPAAEESEDLPAPETVDETNSEDNVEVEDSTPDSDVAEESLEEVAADDAPIEEQSEDEETELEEEAIDSADEDLEPISSDEVAEANVDGGSEMEDIVSKEAEIARLSAEVERLRHSMSGAADIIEEMENPPMPPIVQEDVIIGAHIVADIARMARQLDRDELVRASMGTIAMLHPDRLDVMISTKHKALLPRMNENDICAGKLNADPPRGAPADWRVLEVLLASTNIVTGGPAAVIHCHGPYSTAVSCEKDLVLMQPIDAVGKEHIGKVIIVDPDDDNPRDYLRQVAEALNQGGMRCVVIRGNGAYAVGADLDQAWANAAMLEHSMKIVMLARQANLLI